MVKINKILAVTLAIVVLLAVITGCGSAATTTAPASTTPTTPKVSSPFTQQQLTQLAAESLLATKNTSSLKINMDLTTTTSVDGGAETAEMAMKAQAVFDTPQNQMMMSAEMTTKSGTTAIQTTAFDLYVLSDYVYIKANIPELGEQWIKTQITNDILDSFDANSMQEEMDVLQNPASIEWVGYGTTRNVDCYIIKIIPNSDYLRQYAQQQLSDRFEINWDKVQDMSSIYKKISYNVWIAKDTKLVQKMEISTVIELSSDFAKSNDISFKTATTEISGSLEMYDYNTSVTINLPEEASNAIEVSPEAFSGQ